MESQVDVSPSDVFGDINLVVIKAARACNLRCPYCYYINSDTEDYGIFISEETLALFYRAVAEYLGSSENRSFEFVWHGGEPLLLGQSRFRRFIELQRDYLDSRRCINVVQSNGTLINDDWIRLFAELDVGVGISLDGPPNVHDRRRPKVRGEGSHADAVRAIELFRRAGQEIGVLCVIDPEANGAEVLAHFRGLGVPSCDFLLPMTNNALEVAAPRLGRERIDFAKVGLFLVSAFKDWLASPEPRVSVRLFESLTRNALGLPQGNLQRRVPEHCCQHHLGDRWQSVPRP